MASELVERVAKALNLMDGNISVWGEQEMAKRAIKAVAEFLLSPHRNVTDNYAGKLLLSQLQEPPHE
jgi:hypothetical protein